jgi:hypothetical protein
VRQIEKGLAINMYHVHVHHCDDGLHDESVSEDHVAASIVGII